MKNVLLLSLNTLLLFLLCYILLTAGQCRCTGVVLDFLRGLFDVFGKYTRTWVNSLYSSLLRMQAQRHTVPVMHRIRWELNGTVYHIKAHVYIVGPRFCEGDENNISVFTDLLLLLLMVLQLASLLVERFRQRATSSCCCCCYLVCNPAVIRLVTVTAAIPQPPHTDCVVKPRQLVRAGLVLCCDLRRFSSVGKSGGPGHHQRSLCTMATIRIANRWRQFPIDFIGTVDVIHSDLLHDCHNHGLLNFSNSQFHSPASKNLSTRGSRCNFHAFDQLKGFQSACRHVPYGRRPSWRPDQTLLTIVNIVQTHVVSLKQFLSPVVRCFFHECVHIRVCHVFHKRQL